MAAAKATAAASPSDSAAGGSGTSGAAAAAPADTEQVLAQYQHWSDVYDDDDASASVHATAVECLTRRLRAQHDAPQRRQPAILDVGCGDGVVGGALSERGFRSLTGLDLSPQHVERARARGVYRDVSVMDFSAPLLAFPAECFDGVVIVGAFTFEHIATETLHKCVGVLRSGGWLVVSERVRFYESSAEGLRDVVRALVEDAGVLECAEVRDTPDGWSRPRRCRPGGEASAPARHAAAGGVRTWCFRKAKRNTAVPHAPSGDSGGDSGADDDVDREGERRALDEAFRSDSYERVFTRACAVVNGYPGIIEPEQQDRLCCLYKQATHGDCDASDAQQRPGNLERLLRSKMARRYDLWLTLRGMGKERAMRAYVRETDALAGTALEQLLDNLDAP